tara:strand:- start:783 stop:1124 length:342 start_codon:yes stop_codon:yes gene_type:complete
MQTTAPLFSMSDLVEPADPRPLTINQRFARYDATHPEVWTLFVEFAEAALAAGREQYSARAIIHRIRWECDINRRDSEPFKISNLWSSRYARKLIATDPERWDGFFDLRDIKD